MMRRAEQGGRTLFQGLVMVFQRMRLSGVTVLATGLATIMLLFLLLYAYATSQLGFTEAMASAFLVFSPIGVIGASSLRQRLLPRRELSRDY